MKQITFLLLTLILFNCKSTKTVSTGTAGFDLSKKQLIRANSKAASDFNTLQSKLKVTYTRGGKSQTHNLTFRIKKDEVIWLSAAFALVRAKITPEKVSFYNKLDNTYFDGDFSYISDLLGTELDFEKVQNLLIGETVYNLKEGDYSLSTHEKSYVLQPEQQDELFEIFFLLNPSHYKVDSQQIAQPQEFRMLQIDYPAYQKVEVQTLPERVKIIAVEANDELVLDMEFKSMSLNEDLRFPFKIPSGFDKIELK